MRVVETDAVNSADLLPGADFADAWRLDGLPATDAATVANRAFAAAPGWINALLGLRNAIVSPLGLKTGKRDLPSDSNFVGIFPVLSQQPHRIVMGLDDRHLDFRVVVDVAPSARSTVAATATTYVRTHNLAGRLYMMVIKPFHRIIVRTMLGRAYPKQRLTPPR